MSDVVHLLEEYKADEEQSKKAELEAELCAAKDDKKKAEDRLVEIEGRDFEIAKHNSNYLRKVTELEIMNRDLNNQVNEFRGKLQEMEVAKDGVVRLRGECEN